MAERSKFMNLEQIKAHKTHDFKAFRSRFMNLEHFGLYIPERPHTFASDIFPVKD